MTSVDGMMLIRGCDAGAKVHQRILCFLEETGKAPYPRYVFSLPILRRRNAGGSEVIFN